LSPILYAASAPPMFILSLSLVAFLVHVATYAWVWGLLASLLINTLVFVLVNVGLARIEHMRSPGIRDHLRLCAILYAGLVPLGIFLITGYDGRYCCALQWTLGAALFLVATYAIVLNALISTFYGDATRHLDRPDFTPAWGQVPQNPTQFSSVASIQPVENLR
jgi:hypothetical protein